MLSPLLSLLAGLAMLFPPGMSAVDCNTFKLWTFNIRFNGGSIFCASDCTNEWYKGELAQGRREVAKMYMQRYKPDIFGLQEVRNPVPFIPLVSSQLQDVAGWFPDHQYYAVDRGDGEHCAIFYRKTRFTRLAEGTFWLSCTPDQQSKHPLETGNFRITSWVKLRDENLGTLFYVFNTHMPLNEEAQIYSGALIRAQIAQIAQGIPVIVLGDFNCSETDSPVQILLGNRNYVEPNECAARPTLVPQSSLNLANSFREVVPSSNHDERTYHNFQGGTTGERIDHVFHSANVFGPTAAVIRRDTFEGDCGPTGCLPSDHYALELNFQTLMSEVYVDVNWPESLCEFGTSLTPFNSVLEGVSSAKPGGKVFLKAVATKAPLTIQPTRPVILTSVGGASVLGKQP